MDVLSDECITCSSLYFRCFVLALAIIKVFHNAPYSYFFLLALKNNVLNERMRKRNHLKMLRHGSSQLKRINMPVCIKLRTSIYAYNLIAGFISLTF